MKEDQPCSSSNSLPRKRQADVMSDDDESHAERPMKIPKLKEKDGSIIDSSFKPSCSKDQDIEEDQEDGKNPSSLDVCVSDKSDHDLDNDQDDPRKEAMDTAPDKQHEVNERHACRKESKNDDGKSESKPNGKEKLKKSASYAGDETNEEEDEVCLRRKNILDRMPALTAKPGDAAEPGSSLVNKDPQALHLKLLFRATVRCPDDSSESIKPRRRALSDSYRSESSTGSSNTSAGRNKNDGIFFLMPRTSYSVDDLTEVFQNSKLDYFRPPKVYSRRCYRVDSNRPSAPKVPRFGVADSGLQNVDFASRGLRRCHCPECDQGGVNLMPALSLYPTDWRGNTDQTLSRRFGFQARLVRSHPRSYRTARGGHMQWCRYEEDLIKLPLCLQFEVAFTAPDRHRIKLDIARTVENAPTDIGELGFYFDEEDGILKEKDTNASGFYYVKDRLDKDKRRSRYILAVLGSYNYVSNLMIRENMRVVRKQILRLNGLYDVYSPTIYLSEEAGKREKLIILVASKRVARPGVWSVRTLLHREGGINIGSMLPYIRQGHKEGYSVLVANPNENHFVHPNLVDISHIPKHSSPAEHLAALWAEEIIPATYARHVYLVLHETAYQAFFSPLIRERPRMRDTATDMEIARDEFFHQLQERVRGVALIGAVPQLGMNLALRPQMTRWMLENIINFVPSTEPSETFLKTHSYGQITDIRQLSAGTKDHDRIPETVRSVVFRFFASQNRKWIQKSQMSDNSQSSSASSSTQKNSAADGPSSTSTATSLDS